MALTRLCAQAMERARLYQAERLARALAERAEHRARLLAEVSLAVDAPVGRGTAEGLARLVVPDLGDYCAVRLVEAGGDARWRPPATSTRARSRWCGRCYRRHCSPDMDIGPPR